jgi:shikimate kinase
VNQPLYLIGYRGTGKTTVGRLLAERVGWKFIDADVVLESVAGKSIKDIFAAEGEAGFRDREGQNLRELSARTQCIIATGGGIVLRDENSRILNDTGFVVWLTAPVEEIAVRIAADPSTSDRRPNLTVGGAVEIADLLEQREPLYRACADLEIDTSGRSPEFVVERILTQWNPANSSG